MDKTRNTQPQKRRRHLWIGGGILAGISFVAFVFSLDFTTLRVDRENLRIGTVVRGEFEIKVSGNGTLEPVNVESLASRVAGRVILPTNSGHAAKRLSMPQTLPG